MDLKKVNNYAIQTQQVTNQKIEQEKNKEAVESPKNIEDQNNSKQDYVKMLNDSGVANNVNQTI
ncbi:MAG: hypothetical protein GYA61_01275 [Spirochaetales bacterium]|nr:hypothetical protein [Spirochaetales bacterium]